MDDKYSLFARNLKKFMYDRQILQVDLSNMLGVSKATVSGWCADRVEYSRERGDPEPVLEVFFR